MSKFFWDILSKVRNLDWLGGGLIMSTVATIIVAVVSYVETIPWTFKIPALLLVLCCSLWLWLNWPKLRERIPFQKGETQKVQTVEAITKPKIKFEFIGNWEMGPLCLTKLSPSGSFPETYAEDVTLRITALDNLKNSSLYIKIQQRNIVCAELQLKEFFIGEVAKGIEQTILLYRRTFKLLDTFYMDPLNATSMPVKANHTIEICFFPLLNEKLECTKSISDAMPYQVFVQCFHETGPDMAVFSISSNSLRPHTKVLAATDNLSIVPPHTIGF